jgi:phenylacetate-CoA ligase
MLEHFRTLSQIWRMPHASCEVLLDFRVRKLKSVVRHAYESVPYYHSLFVSAGLKPEDIQTPADLHAIPITSSRDFRALSLSQTVSKAAKPEWLVRRATSGSSGTPFVIRRTAAEDHLLNQFRLRAFRSFGLKLTDRLAHVRLVSSSHKRESLAGHVRQKLGLYREYPVDCLQPAPAITRQLADLDPDVVKGYPSVLTHVSSHLLQSPEPNFRPRFIIAGGETLTDFRRSQIQRGFSRPVFDIYGSHEFNLLAWQCSCTGDYHICEDNVILEVLKDGRPASPGERGEVVATGLHSYSMPFIRYRMGDIVMQGAHSCPCGAPFATLRAIEGRMHDYFRMPDGTFIHPDKIVVPIMEAEASWFDRYCLLQVHTNEIILYIQPSRKPAPEQLAHIKTIARNQLPAEVRFDVELVDKLEPEAGGKFRFCRSLVESHLDVAKGAESI